MISRKYDSRDIGKLYESSQTVIQALAQRFGNADRPEPSFPISKVSKLIGRSSTAIHNAENSGKVVPQERNDKGHRLPYPLSKVNQLRDYFDVNPFRDPKDEPVILGVQNFKGGCGKSTISVHLAQALATKGYRVLLMDCDAQASSTELMGFNSNSTLGIEDTIYPYLTGDMDSFEPLVRKSHWDRLDLIPATLELYQSEYLLAALANKDSAFLMLRNGLQSVAHNYDVIIIDPPPALGMISLSVMNAVNALLIPIKPTAIDFASTSNFFAMLENTIETLHRQGYPQPQYKFLKILVNSLDRNKSTHVEMYENMAMRFPEYMMKSFLANSAAIDNASSEYSTVYDMSEKVSTQVQKRCVTMLTDIVDEVEGLITDTWKTNKSLLLA